jgi:hypothetical protein
MEEEGGGGVFNLSSSSGERPAGAADVDGAVAGSKRWARARRGGLGSVRTGMRGSGGGRRCCGHRRR